MNGSRRIPSLDGLRAISILLVILQHSFQRFQGTHQINKYWGVLCNGFMGVYIFFVISGFLITTLLVNEYDRSGRIVLGRFYFRRVLRIFPPLYFYLAIVAILSFMDLLHMTRLDFLATALFFRNYSAGANLWALEHTWSLSVEEQFYLLWPLVLLLCLRHAPKASGRINAARVALWVIAICPLIRVLTSLLGNSFILHGNYAMFHSRADALMFGCAIALLIGTPTFERFYGYVAKVWWLFPLALVLSSGLETRYLNYWDFSIGYSLDGLCIAVLLLWCVRNPDTWVGRLLNCALVRHIGVLSYSIYIWQTFFLHHNSRQVFGGDTVFNSLPTSWFFILVAAELSYWLVERPSLLLRSRIESRWRKSRSPEPASVSA